MQCMNAKRRFSLRSRNHTFKGLRFSRALSFLALGILVPSSIPAETASAQLPHPTACQLDVQGWRDQIQESADLAHFCGAPGDSLPLDLYVSVGWEHLMWVGTSTSCALLDTDSDTNADLAACGAITFDGVMRTDGPNFYACSDGAANRCTDAQQINVCTGGRTCLTDIDCPFGETCARTFNSEFESSVQGQINLSVGPSQSLLYGLDLNDFDLSEGEAKLLDACSYASPTPTVEPSDCILFQGCTGASECDDDNPCTVDTCGESGSCVHTAEPGAACFDRAACIDGACTSLGLCGSGFEICDDGIDCTHDLCDVTQRNCAFSPSNRSCRDSSYCNGVEICNALTGCESGPPSNVRASHRCAAWGTVMSRTIGVQLSR